MSLSDAAESALLSLIFQNSSASLIGDATGLRGSSTAGNLYIALHSADPTDAGNQSSNELSYTGYARVSVVRSSGGWTVSGTSPTQATNVAAVTFPACTGGSATATYFSVGTALSGAGEILFSGALSASLAVSNGITPQMAIGACVCTLD